MTVAWILHKQHRLILGVLVAGRYETVTRGHCLAHLGVDEMVSQSVTRQSPWGEELGQRLKIRQSPSGNFDVIVGRLFIASLVQKYIFVCHSGGAWWLFRDTFGLLNRHSSCL